MARSNRILLVDDCQMDTEMALDALQSYHLATEEVTLRDGSEALDYLYRRGQFAGRTNEQPAVILLDLKMPKVDGLEVLRQVKNDLELRVIPVVMLTSSIEESDLLRSYQNGANAYVVKPVNSQEFEAAVKQVGLFWTVLNQPPPIC